MKLFVKYPGRHAKIGVVEEAYVPGVSVIVWTGTLAKTVAKPLALLPNIMIPQSEPAFQLAHQEHSPTYSPELAKTASTAHNAVNSQQFALLVLAAIPKRCTKVFAIMSAQKKHSQ